MKFCPTKNTACKSIGIYKAISASKDVPAGSINYYCFASTDQCSKQKHSHLIRTRYAKTSVSQV